MPSKRQSRSAGGRVVTTSNAPPVSCQVVLGGPARVLDVYVDEAINKWQRATYAPAGLAPTAGARIGHTAFMSPDQQTICVVGGFMPALSDDDSKNGGAAAGAGGGGHYCGVGLLADDALSDSGVSADGTWCSAATHNTRTPIPFRTTDGALSPATSKSSRSATSPLRQRQDGTTRPNAPPTRRDRSPSPNAPAPKSKKSLKVAAPPAVARANAAASHTAAPPSPPHVEAALFTGTAGTVLEGAVDPHSISSNAGHSSGTITAASAHGGDSGNHHRGPGAPAPLPALPTEWRTPFPIMECYNVLEKYWFAPLGVQKRGVVVTRGSGNPNCGGGGATRWPTQGIVVPLWEPSQSQRRANGLVPSTSEGLDAAGAEQEDEFGKGGTGQCESIRQPVKPPVPRLSPITRRQHPGESSSSILPPAVASALTLRPSSSKDTPVGRAAAAVAQPVRAKRGAASSHLGPPQSQQALQQAHDTAIAQALEKEMRRTAKIQAEKEKERRLQEERRVEREARWNHSPAEVCLVGGWDGAHRLSAVLSYAMQSPAKELSTAEILYSALPIAGELRGMPELCNHTGTLVRGRLYVFGGNTAGGCSSDLFVIDVPELRAAYEKEKLEEASMMWGSGTDAGTGGKHRGSVLSRVLRKRATQVTAAALMTSLIGSGLVDVPSIGGEHSSAGGQVANLGATIATPTTTTHQVARKGATMGYGDTWTCTPISGPVADALAAKEAQAAAEAYATALVGTHVSLAEGESTTDVSFIAGAADGAAVVALGGMASFETATNGDSGSPSRPTTSGAQRGCGRSASLATLSVGGGGHGSATFGSAGNLNHHPASPNYQRVPPPIARSSHSACSLAGRFIVIYGGRQLVVPATQETGSGRGASRTAKRGGDPMKPRKTISALGSAGRAQGRSGSVRGRGITGLLGMTLGDHFADEEAPTLRLLGDVCAFDVETHAWVQVRLCGGEAPAPRYAAALCTLPPCEANDGAPQLLLSTLPPVSSANPQTSSPSHRGLYGAFPLTSSSLRHRMSHNEREIFMHGGVGEGGAVLSDAWVLEVVSGGNGNSNNSNSASGSLLEVDPRSGALTLTLRWVRLRAEVPLVGPDGSVVTEEIYQQQLQLAAVAAVAGGSISRGSVKRLTVVSPPPPGSGEQADVASPPKMISLLPARSHHVALATPLREVYVIGGQVPPPSVSLLQSSCVPLPAPISGRSTSISGAGGGLANASTTSQPFTSLDPGAGVCKATSSITASTSGQGAVAAAGGMFVIHVPTLHDVVEEKALRALSARRSTKR